MSKDVDTETALAEAYREGFNDAKRIYKKRYEDLLCTQADPVRALREARIPLERLVLLIKLLEKSHVLLEDEKKP